MMEAAVNNAEKCFIEQKYNCAESCLLALCQAWEISSDAVPRIAAGFGAGVGKKGMICGALSGTIMAIGLRFGSSDPTDTEARKLITNYVSKLVDNFRDSFGEADCRKLIGCDLSTPEGMLKAKVEKIRTEKCRHFVRYAVELATDLCA